MSTDPSTGKANIDTDGDGFADSAGVLAAFGITDEERLALPNQFASNTKLIRVQLPHLSKWDINWNIAPPAGAGGPNAPGPSGGPPDCTSPVVGSIIECESRALAEELPITGTPFTLRYQSDRTPGYHIPIKIPLSGSRGAPSLRRSASTGRSTSRVASSLARAPTRSISTSH
ncbi:MAG: hypothetical protein U0174_16370 [Polyangiaceae bacterium]